MNKYLGSLRPYSKAVLSLIGAVVAGIVTALADNSISDAEWVNIAILAVGSLAVFFGPNTKYARYTKSILAALTAGLVGLQSAITDGVTTTEWLQILLAVLTAAGVYGVQNQGKNE